MTNIYVKLLRVKKSLKAVLKKSDNPFFSSKYADLNAYLDEIEPKLQEEGLVLLQPCVLRPDGKQVVKSIIKDSVSDEYIESEMELLVEKKDMQKLGSAVSYARRYSLSALLAMQTNDDDDGNTASGNKQKVYKKKSSLKVEDEEF